MNTVLVTGATGFLGKQLAIRLAREGNRVHALYRSEEKIRGWEDPNILFFMGTLGDAGSIERAMKGCRQVFHVAGYASSWAKNSGIFYEENVGGTVNVLESALRQGVEKFVFTSTAGVLGPSGVGINTEDKSYDGRHFTHYDRSKAEAENRVLEYFARGLQAVIVNPTRIYGPGNLSTSNALTRIIGRYLEGRWRIIPGDGSIIGNYVFIEDAVSCHILAMEKGRPGERYLAGGSNLTFNEFFEYLARISGIRRKLFRMPTGLMMFVAWAFGGLAHLTGLDPPITPAFVRRYRQNWVVSTAKAERELGYRPHSFEEGLGKTITWIRSQNIR
jgi:nucleoside-diphosphate-sugar epimerase